MNLPTNTKVLVTGGAGYIGSHAVRALVAAGHQVTVIDNLVYGHRKALVDDSVTFVEGDLGDSALLTRLFATNRFAAVMHFAAFAYVGESVEDPLKYYQNNLSAPLNLLAVMQEYGCQQFIFSSTCATYGQPEQIPIDEAEKQNPINPYGRSKLMLEQILRDCENAWGLKSVFLRYFNACGASLDGVIGEDHDPETHLIPLVLMAIRGERGELSVFGDDYETPDGTCVRDYIHVEDLAEAHVLALDYLQKEKSSNVFNLGTGSGISVKEILDMAEKVTGQPVPYQIAPRREGDPAILIAKAEKARRELGWTPSRSDIETILRTAWAWKGSYS
ncbi:UDP-glucose 4-epimerase GalE [Roseibacillus ishigakijimensis]|uniref:UDP-glucose 4-epimerase n=1 Tax=Roseibacillus ishigakijimensis TaxID=454146 RepID=A0A934RM81_9BACT|nr:UDP-glucose 4-epimerase GalE [Roseibacillus ishigakijimensis]MBK1833408.1 UDP-glucose 4-epimerase GalE [Roseibacillus ishigakijimensis]